MSEPGPGNRQKRGWRQILRIGLGTLAVAFVLVGAFRERRDIADALQELRIGTVALAGAFVLVGLGANMLSWREVLKGLGSSLPVAVAGRVYLVAQLGKYIPGSIWPVLAQIELARDHGVPRVRSGVAALAALLVGLVVGAVVAVACLLPTADSPILGWWALLIVPAALAVLHPRSLRWSVSLALRLARRPQDEVTIDAKALWRSAAWSLVMWVALGGHVFVLARDLGARSPTLLVLSIGAYAAAWTVGLLVAFAPAGAGAREAALVLALGSVLSRPDALALALVSRSLTLVGDLASGGAGIAAAMLHRRRQPPSADRSTPSPQIHR